MHPFWTSKLAQLILDEPPLASTFIPRSEKPLGGPQIQRNIAKVQAALAISSIGILCDLQIHAVPTVYMYISLYPRSLEFVLKGSKGAVMLEKTCRDTGPAPLLGGWPTGCGVEGSFPPRAAPICEKFGREIFANSQSPVSNYLKLLAFQN